MGLPTSGGRAEASLTAWAPRPRTRGSRVRPPDRRLHATNPGPTFANKVSRETRALGANPHPPRGDPSLGGSEGGDVGRGEAGGAGASPAPAGSIPRVPARRPHPPSSEPPPTPRTPGNARSQGGGDTRASEALRSPLGPPPCPSAYLC